MGAREQGAAGAVIVMVVVAAVAVLASCGPAHLSALGNPGDLCTEETACVEGTQCRITELGYRCVGRDGRLPDSVTSGGDDEPGPGDGRRDDEVPPGRSPGEDDRR
jgi:hypothetical protein